MSDDEGVSSTIWEVVGTSVVVATIFFLTAVVAGWWWGVATVIYRDVTEWIQ